MKITIGSTIIGKSGKKLRVDRVEGDIIYSGDLKILSTAVVRVIPMKLESIAIYTPDIARSGSRLAKIRCYWWDTVQYT